MSIQTLSAVVVARRRSASRILRLLGLSYRAGRMGRDDVVVEDCFGGVEGGGNDEDVGGDDEEDGMMMCRQWQQKRWRRVELLQ